MHITCKVPFYVLVKEVLVKRAIVCHPKLLNLSIDNTEKSFLRYHERRKPLQAHKA